MPIAKRTSALTAIFCALLNASAFALPEADLTGLSEDKVTVTDLSKPAAAGKTFMAMTIIDAPVQKICSVILDYRAYPRFMPNTDATSIVQVEDDFSVIDMTLKLPLGKYKRYRLRMQTKLDPQSCHVAWSLIPREDLPIEETIADTTGYWQLTPDPSHGNKTLVKYFVYSDPGPVPYGLGWIVASLSKHSLPRTLEAVRTRVAAQ